MSKGSKGGSSGASAPSINLNPTYGGSQGGSLGDTEMQTSDLANYINTLLNPAVSESNWAESLATGGNVSFPGQTEGGSPFTSNVVGFNQPAAQTYPSMGEVSGSATPSTYTGMGAGVGGLPGSEISPTTSTGGGASTSGSGASASGVTASYIPSSVSIPQWQQWYSENVGKTIGVGGSTETIGTGAGQLDPATLLSDFQAGTVDWNPAQTSQNLQGPLLSGATNALATESSVAGSIPPGVDPTSIGNLESQFFGNANPANIPGGTLPSSGLYPDQQALINAQTQSAQAATAQSEANMGLTGSTQGAELSGEIGQQGAAEAGQLIQGNLEIAQNAQTVAQGWAKLGMGEQAIGMGEQEQQFTQFAQISQQYAGLQSQMWGEAIQGQGVLSGFVNQLLGAYGLNTTQSNDVLQAEESQAQDQTQLEAASMQEQAQGTSSLFSGLGSIFSGSGSSGLGSLFGSVGSALGIGGGISAGGAAAAAGAGTAGAAGASGIALDTVFTVLAF